MKSKNLDCVKLMRKIRDEMSDSYRENPQAEQRDLEKIRARYGLQDRSGKKELIVK